MHVSGILETALNVTDVVRSADFYRRLFGFGTLLESERLTALNVAGRNVLLLFLQGASDAPVVIPGGVIPGHNALGTSHLAFAIAAEEVTAWEDRLNAEGVAIESTVDWPEGARSVYFRDPDGHLIELVTPGLWTLS